MNKKELKEFLDAKADQYERPDFIASDPIQIPHQFQIKEDIEIAAFLVATIAWGNRKSIINNGNKLMDLLGRSPYDFVMHHTDAQLEPVGNFVHRTFNGVDAQYFIKGLQNIYTKKGGLEAIFKKHATVKSLNPAIHEFKKEFFTLPHPSRTEKHVSDPMKNSAAKRIHMFLRWMVRPNTKEVDFGIWKSLQTSQLSCPLDVHTGTIARKLGILTRKQNDAKALEELDQNLRRMDPIDPVKYDFALFGLGALEDF